MAMPRTSAARVTYMSCDTVYSLIMSAPAVLSESTRCCASAGVEETQVTVLDHFSSRYLLCCQALPDVGGAGVKPHLR